MQYQVHPATGDDAAGIIAVGSKAFANSVLHQNIFPKELEHLTPREDLIAWRVKKQKERVTNRDVLYFKAVDGESGRIIGYSGWWKPGHFKKAASTKDGEQSATQQTATGESHGIVEPKPDVEAPKEDFPACMNVDLHKRFMATLDAKREEVWGENANYWWLGALAVDPDYQRKGIARMLLQPGLTWAGDAGLPIYLEATPDGAPLYLRNGFEALGVVPIEGCNYQVDLMIRQPAKAST